MSDRETLRQLLRRGEAQDLDWKRDFPGELRGGRTSEAWEVGKAKILKDLVAIANGLDEGKGHLVYGVKDHGTNREVGGKTGRRDDAEFQTWVQNVFEPRILFTYTEVEWEPGIEVGLFEVEVSPEYPHVVDRSIGGILYEGQVWSRRGTQNFLAKNADLRRMILRDEPITSGGINGRIVQEAVEYYESNGYEVGLPRIPDKFNKMAEGWTVAHFPGTRSEIHVGRAVGQPELILMKRPNDANDR